MTHTRRGFLKAALAASAAPALIPASAFGANERVALALIGSGGRGRWLAKEAFAKLPEARVVAACDVDAGMLAQGVDTINQAYGDSDCKGYRDFREVLARKDIDGVIVATPDHWHALVGIAAARAGKHVYGEKPLANSIGESKALRDAVRTAGVVFQTGSMERSRDNARYACEVVRNGFIGALKTIRINLPTDQGHHNNVRKQTAAPAAEAPPAGLDWAFWLGHTPDIPYRPGIHPGQWRFIRSFGCGEMSDRGAHVIDIAQLGGNFDATGPVAVEARGWDAPHGLYDTPMSFEFTNVYANGVKMIGGTEGSPRGVRFEGDEGWIFLRIHEGTLEASDPKLLTLDPKTFKESLGRAPSHWQNFIDAVKRGARPFADVEVGHRSATACLVNMLAMQLKRKLAWDPVAERFTDDDEANRLSTPALRAPWSLA
ncbi:MAG: Gfo/Idh/MocA family oxidoreductase [Verrucomicrobiota bacterium]|jgi:predicted dehydrogenase|nr:Gfo/Idh/MocA family oxidoreductase [Verrucomicrobiota bacterium]